MRIFIDKRTISDLRQIAKSSSNEVCGALALNSEDSLTVETNFERQSRKAVCKHSQFGFHTHPAQAYGDSVYGWPGKTDLLTFCLSVVDAMPMIAHFVVAVEGVYVMMLRDMIPCSKCERKAKILKIADIIQEIFAKKISTPTQYCHCINTAHLPLKISLIPHDSTESRYILDI